MTTKCCIISPWSHGMPIWLHQQHNFFLSHMKGPYFPSRPFHIHSLHPYPCLEKTGNFLEKIVRAIKAVPTQNSLFSFSPPKFFLISHMKFLFLFNYKSLTDSKQMVYKGSLSRFFSLAIYLSTKGKTAWWNGQQNAIKVINTDIRRSKGYLSSCLLSSTMKAGSKFCIYPYIICITKILFLQKTLGNAGWLFHVHFRSWSVWKGTLMF